MKLPEFNRLFSFRSIFVCIHSNNVGKNFQPFYIFLLQFCEFIGSSPFIYLLYLLLIEYKRATFIFLFIKNGETVKCIHSLSENYKFIDFKKSILYMIPKINTALYNHLFKRFSQETQNEPLKVAVRALVLTFYRSKSQYLIGSEMVGKDCERNWRTMFNGAILVHLGGKTERKNGCSNCSKKLYRQLPDELNTY